jgi:hypothetical protein
MNTLPSEIKFNEVIKHLSSKDILELCRTNVEFNKICQNDVTWKYLLYRDFGVDYTNKIRNEYLLHKSVLDFLTKYYPVITQKALETFINLVPISIWPIFEIAVHEHREEFGEESSPILSINELSFLSNAEYESGEKVFNKFYNNLPNQAYKNFLSTYPNIDEITRQLDNRNYDQYNTFISHPSLIFVNKKPVIINYDYDLASELRYIYALEKQFEPIEKEILSLANIF